MRFSIILCLLIMSCSRQLLKQAPVLDKSETMWTFTENVGVIKHNRCEKLEGEDRECIETLENIMDMWNTFYPGHIIIPKRRVFR